MTRINIIIENLKKLSAIPGISGREQAVRDEIIEQIKSYCEYSVDPLGNLIVFKKGEKSPKNKVLYAAHMDEVGFIITDITEAGMLRFTNIGGVDPRVIYGKSLEIGENKIIGIIGGKAIHHVSDDEKNTVPPIESLLIDIGTSTKEEAEQFVLIGDFAVFSSSVLEIGDNSLVGKAFDDRLGCSLMIDMIKSALKYDAYFAFTVQEEIGCIGAITAGYSVGADISVAIETTTASDIAGVEPERYACRQGMGPVVSFKDGGAIYDKELYELALITAKNNSISVQPKTVVAGGNDSRSLQTSKNGSRILAVSVPTRYLHSASNMINITDVESTAKLLEILTEKLAEV